MNGKIKTCYISTSGESSLAALRKALYDRGISIVSPEIGSVGAASVPGNSFNVNEADLVIGILSRLRRSDWVLFEIGAAWANQQKILLVVPPGANFVPLVGLNGVLVVRANPNNINAISFALDQLLSAPDSVVSSSLPRQSSPVGISIKDLEIDAQQAVIARDGLALESVVAKALERAQLDGISNETLGQKSRADFAVWVDELASSVGNPLLIEVKLELLSATSLRAAAAQLSAAVTASGTRFGLLLYGEGPDVAREHTSLPFNVLSIPVSEFLGSLRTRSFAAVVGHLRNQRVHGVDN